MLGVICAMQWMVFFVLGLFSGHVMLAQSTDSIHAIWWNLENAFDTIDQPNVADEAFTPQGVKQWGSQRYHVKLQRLAQGLMAVSQGRPPEIMAFAEVENAEVMVDLLRKLPLSWSHWILHQDSPDARGIDVAVMYDPQRIKVLQVAWLQPKGSPSRDAVQVTFYCRKGGDSLTLLFVHLPSQRDPRPHRRLHAMQSILSQCEQVDCLVGDMNEHPKGPMGQASRGRNACARCKRATRHLHLPQPLVMVGSCLAGRSKPLASQCPACSLWFEKNQSADDNSPKFSGESLPGWVLRPFTCINLAEAIVIDYVEILVVI